ncbi:hypothetical protein EFK69_09485 [Lactococcus lactis subsp. lactis]|nr:hypothetical protein [Lactococcus lactis subsp. lactis]
MSKPNFINHEIVFNPTGNEFDECRSELLGSYQLVKIEDYEYKFIKQHHLMIPKSIAKLIDTGDTKYIRWAYAEELIVSSDVVEDEWKAHEKREYEIVRRKALIQAYLAGKALGVDLVKVGDDE